MLTSVDDPGRLWRLGASAYGPLPDLVRTRCEETSEVERLPHGGDDFWQGRLHAQSLALCLGLCFGLKACQALLEAYG